MIVEVGAKTAPTSTIFIYILGSKSLGSSLTSQIAAKTAANCDVRLKTHCIIYFQLYLIYEILYKKCFLSSYNLINYFYSLWSGLLVVIFNIILILLYIYLLIFLDSELIFMEFGYRHRALRFNLLSKERSKGFSLQSLTQIHF